MGLSIEPIKSIFPVSDERAEGLGADTKQIILKNTNKYYEVVQVDELNNACNILELQVAAAVTPTDLANMEVEIFSDADGYLDKVDTDSTTAYFSTNKYTTAQANISIANDTTGYGNTNALCDAHVEGYISSIAIFSTAGDVDMRVDIIQNGSTLASKTADTGVDDFITFGSGDYTSLIQPGSFYLKSTKTGGAGAMGLIGSKSFSNNTWSVDTQNMVGGGAHPEYIIFTRIAANRIVQSVPMSCPNGIDHLQVFPYKATGSITTDITVNSGSHWQTGVPVNTVLNNSLRSNNIIIKLNLNLNGSENATCRGFGVRYWAND